MQTIEVLNPTKAETLDPDNMIIKITDSEPIEEFIAPNAKITGKDLIKEVSRQIPYRLMLDEEADLKIKQAEIQNRLEEIATQKIEIEKQKAGLEASFEEMIPK
jgi:hypothetical protein